MGMTVIEIVVAVALVGILLSLAVPSYQRYLERGHRSEAVRMLLIASACQERQRARNGVFDASRCTASNNQHYRLVIETDEQQSPAGFMLLAQPRGGQLNDICGTLSLDQSGSRGISGPQDRLLKCWGGR